MVPGLPHSSDCIRRVSFVVSRDEAFGTSLMEEVEEDPSMIAVCNQESKRNWKAGDNSILILKTDTNTDTDTDTETDAEMNANPGTETKAITVTETDTGTDTKTDTETDAETNVGTDTKVLAVYQKYKR